MDVQIRSEIGKLRRQIEREEFMLKLVSKLAVVIVIFMFLFFFVKL